MIASPNDPGGLTRRGFLLAATAADLLRMSPPLPATIPFTLQAMQQQTLDLYAELAG